MIKSDAQLERTRAQVQGFESLVDDFKARTDLPEAVKVAAVQSHEGMIAKLTAEIAGYEELKRGYIRLPRITSLMELAAHLTKFRIALGFTQEHLASIVDVSRQTINKHEEQEYQTADVALIGNVMNALGILPDIRVQHQRLAVEQPTSQVQRSDLVGA